MNRAVSVAAIGFFLLVSGCGKDPVTIPSQQVLSPDKKLIATSVILNWDGPGNNADATSVRMQLSGYSAPPTEILGFDQNGTYDCYITLHWQDNAHLDVGYKGCGLVFQAVKAFGVAISVHYITNIR
jgi:hypothetical protein